MESSTLPRPASRPLVAWLALALITSAPIWWLHAIPVITRRSAGEHPGHFLMVFTHMLGGTAMIFAGAAALYLGTRRVRLPWHRNIGRAYLLVGGLGALTGLLLSFRNAHKVSGIMLATGTLAATWLAVAYLAWRAARNRRIAVHREMMIRSYVLTWTFVGCRIAGRVPGAEGMGDAGGAGVVWMAWVIPLVVCELILQWPRVHGTRVRDA